MLGLLLIYFIGKRFYDLSIDYNQKKWLYAILGVITYYVVGTVFVVFITIFDVYFFDWGFDWDNNFGMNLLVLPSGLLAVWGLYHILENKWKKSVIVIKDEINDIGKNAQIN